MCGRFTITLEPAAFQEELELGRMPSEWKPRYNVAPGQPIPAVRDAEKRDVTMLRWGLVPAWAKEPAIGYRMINARSETLSEKPSFRSAFRQRRCLILADGFFEWQQPAVRRAPKAPFYFQLLGSSPFAFAGLWETWHLPERPALESCTIITCAPNELVARFHNRMPVILDKETCWTWLSDAPLPDLQQMLKAYPPEKMTAHPVGQAVNNPRFDDPQIIQPLAE
jgi:putative SOS response-associated peptidase YedK